MIFGNDVAPTTGNCGTYSLINHIGGGFFQAGTGGGSVAVNSISAYIKRCGSASKYKALIYTSNKIFVAESIEQTYDCEGGTGLEGWVTFIIPGNVTLALGESYYLVVWSNSATTSNLLFSFNGTGLYTQTVTYGIAPNPWTATYAGNVNPCIYCDYTSSGGETTLCDWLVANGAPSITSAAVFVIIDALLFNTPPTGYTFIPTATQVLGVIDYYLGFDGDSKTGCSVFSTCEGKTQTQCVSPCYWYNDSCHSMPQIGEGHAEISLITILPDPKVELYISNIGETDDVWYEIYQDGVLKAYGTYNISSDATVSMYYNVASPYPASVKIDTGHIENGIGILDDTTTLTVYKCSAQTTQATCEACGCYWYNNECNYIPQGTCETLTTQSRCTNYGCYWYDNSCHTEPNPNPPPSACTQYTTMLTCMMAGCYWYNNSCHDTPA